MNSNEKKKVSSPQRFYLHIRNVVPQWPRAEGGRVGGMADGGGSVQLYSSEESIGSGRLERRKGGEGHEKRGMEREAKRRGERKINKVIKHALRAEMTS